jgi:protein-arginine kinase activator protein McsA
VATRKQKRIMSLYTNIAILELRLAEAVEREHYELAAKIRDEIYDNRKAIMLLED